MNLNLIETYYDLIGLVGGLQALSHKGGPERRPSMFPGYDLSWRCGYWKINIYPTVGFTPRQDSRQPLGYLAWYCIWSDQDSPIRIASFTCIAELRSWGIIWNVCNVHCLKIGPCGSSLVIREGLPCLCMCKGELTWLSQCGPVPTINPTGQMPKYARLN